MIFGGRQIRESNGLQDVLQLTLNESSQSPSPDRFSVTWTSPSLSGDVPGLRRGHSTIPVGPHLLLIGGQDVHSGALFCDVRILDVPTLRWRLPVVEGEAPSTRRGFKMQFFGTSVVISSGFVANASTAKITEQLADDDIHVLTFR
ncbi:hypothetical protein PINS_up011908 [Pythium insidiosum]|nr:hypothetical protein PINS_up011908 [Pythium insidiosum]